MDSLIGGYRKLIYIDYINFNINFKKESIMVFVRCENCEKFFEANEIEVCDSCGKFICQQCERLDCCPDCIQGEIEFLAKNLGDEESFKGERE